MGTINDKLNEIKGTKNGLKQAFRNKGVTVNDSDTFRSYVQKLEDYKGIDTSDATAEPNHIQMGETAYVNGQKIEGTLQVSDDPFVNNNPRVEYTETDGLAFMFNKSNTEIIRESTLIRTSADTNKLQNAIPELDSNNIKEGVNILGVEGSVIELKGQDKTIIPTTEEQTITPDDNYNALNQVVVNPVTSEIDENIIAENILQGKTILGVDGNVVEREQIDEELTLQEETIDILINKINNKAGISANECTATPEDIAEGKTAYVKGEIITGTASIGNYILPNGARFTYYNGSLPINIKTTEIIDMSYMFNNAYISNFDKIKLDTSNANNMNSMFQRYGGSNLDISNFDTSKVTNMSSMFNSCSTLTFLNVSNFDTSEVTDMVSMFANCTGLTSLDLRNFNVNKVKQASYMFEKCSKLEELEIDNWNLEQITNMSSMFTGCNKLTETSLNRILKMCQTTTKLTTKTLKYLGLTSAQATVCQTLSNYQAFLDAGWTTGY